jgi:hypothetical protein
MSGYASRQEVREVTVATLRAEGRDPAEYNVDGIMRDAFYPRNPGYGALDEQAWRDAVARHEKQSRPPAATTTEAEVNGNLAAVGEEIQRAGRPPSRTALWSAGYDAGGRDTQRALRPGQRQTSLNWHRPDDTLPADLADRCEWLRGYSASIRATIADASDSGKFTPDEAAAESALAAIVARFKAEQTQQPTLRALTHHRSGYKITIERAD